MTDSLPTCDSASLPICRKYNAEKAEVNPTPGYHCVDSLCVECPVGSYGTDGQDCLPCATGSWTLGTGNSECKTIFTYATAGEYDLHIPWGVNKIYVQLWGAGGGGDYSVDSVNLIPHSGGSGGYLSCYVNIEMSSNIQVIVGGGGNAGAPKLNLGGFGGGGAGYAIVGYSSGAGGGRSALRQLNEDLVTAGGGGGGSDCERDVGCGGGGGGGGGMGGLFSSHIASGRGGTEFDGGSAGNGSYCNGAEGRQYRGGDGCKATGSSAVSGAGGGGGYYGGGGGSVFGDAAVEKVRPDMGGGGGGGSGYAGGCAQMKSVHESGVTGDSKHGSLPGGATMGGYTNGVGVGGNPAAVAGASGNAGGPGFVKIKYILDKTFEHKSPQPTSQPSSRPTGPSSQPTGQPTSEPSSSPSGQPSSTPSSQPSSMPSSGPSSGPTSYPTSFPTSVPTTKPSSLPTSSPSGQPTSQPTQSPKILGVNIHYAFITTGLCGVLALIGYAYYRYTRMRRIKRSKSDPPEDDGDLSLIISGAARELNDDDAERGGRFRGI